MSRLRPLGQVTEDLEKLLHEMYIDHELQEHEVLGIIHFSTRLHFPGAVERFEEDGSNPSILYADLKHYQDK